MLNRLKFISGVFLAFVVLALLSINQVHASPHENSPDYNVNVKQYQDTYVKTNVSQDQDQIQKQNQQQTNGELNNSVAFNNPRQTASAIAPTIVLPDCMNSASAGVQRPTFGVSLGFAKQDGHCEMLQDVAYLKSMGMQDTAKHRMCQDKKLAKAFKDSGEFLCLESGE